MFVAHVGLEDLFNLREIWNKIPLRRTVRGAYWSFPRDEIPIDQTEFSEWLFEQWARVDRWIADNESAVYDSPAT